MRTSPHWWASTFVEDFKHDLKLNQGVTLEPAVEGRLFAASLKLIQDVAKDTREDLEQAARYGAHPSGQ